MGDVSMRSQSAETPLQFELAPKVSTLFRKNLFEAARPIVYSGRRNSNTMKRKPGESALDRLIALATDDKPAEPRSENSVEDHSAEDHSVENHTDLEAVPIFDDTARDMELEHNPMWKALAQFRVLLPYISRLLEMSHTESSPALSAELKQSVGDLAVAQRDLRMAVQDQVASMKHLEEEVTRTREVTERNTTENLEVVEDVRSVHSMVKRAGIVVGGLLLVLIVLVIWLLVRVPTHS